MTAYPRSLQWLQKPFPLIESIRDILLISLGSGAVVLAILIVFKPFGIETIDRDMFLYLSGYSLIDTTITAVLLLIPRIFPDQIKPRLWTTGKNLAAIICLMVAIAVCNYLYGEYLARKDYVEGFKELHRGGILTWLLMTFSVGVIPLLFALYFIEKRLFTRNQLLAEEYNNAVRDSPVNIQETQISFGSGNDPGLAIRRSDFICIRSEGGNYATLFWHEGTKIKKTLLRITLVGFLDQLKSDDSIVRCHKSYVINLDHVLSFQGNARSVHVVLKGLDFEVPVSRTFPREKLRTGP